LHQVDLHALYRQSIEEDEAGLDSAFAEGDRAHVGHFAHRLKGAALMVDARAMAGYAESVEMTARSNAPLSDATDALASLQEEVSRWLAGDDVSAR
jgi:HPt (histidine-containing phosphotransfer) domain-containing protein